MQFICHTGDLALNPTKSKMDRDCPGRKQQDAFFRTSN